MVENLQAKLYQLENKQVKGAKLRANIRSWRAKKCPKTLFKELERQNMQYQTILELYTDDNKSKYSRNPKDILKSEKKQKKKNKEKRKKESFTSCELPQLLLLNLFGKFLTERNS